MKKPIVSLTAVFLFSLSVLAETFPIEFNKKALIALCGEPGTYAKSPSQETLDQALKPLGFVKKIGNRQYEIAHKLNDKNREALFTLLINQSLKDGVNGAIKASNVVFDYCHAKPISEPDKEFCNEMLITNKYPSNFAGPLFEQFKFMTEQTFVDSAKADFRKPGFNDSCIHRRAFHPVAAPAGTNNPQGTGKQ